MLLMLMGKLSGRIMAIAIIHRRPGHPHMAGARVAKVRLNHRSNRGIMVRAIHLITRPDSKIRTTGVMEMTATGIVTEAMVKTASNSPTTFNPL